MTSTTLNAVRDETGPRQWAQRVARWGFWFFLAKGLLWLVLPWVAWTRLG